MFYKPICDYLLDKHEKLFTAIFESIYDRVLDRKDVRLCLSAEKTLIFQLLKYNHLPHFRETLKLLEWPSATFKDQ